MTSIKLREAMKALDNARYQLGIAVNLLRDVAEMAEADEAVSEYMESGAPG